MKKKVRKKSIKITERGKAVKIFIFRNKMAINAIIGEDKADAVIMDKTSLREI